MSFLEAVNEKYGELSPVQKRIAVYMYKYPDEACFFSLREMANALGGHRGDGPQVCEKAWL